MTILLCIGQWCMRLLYNVGGLILYVLNVAFFSFSLIISTPYITLSTGIIKGTNFFTCKGTFSSHLLQLLGEFSYSSIIFFVKILIQFVACVFLSTGLFIVLVNIDLSSFLWGLVIFSQLTTFSAWVWAICTSPLFFMYRY